MPAAPGQQMEEHVIINVEFDNGVRGSKVTFGCREMVNFAFSEESGKMNLEQVFRLMIAQRKTAQEGTTPYVGAWLERHHYDGTLGSPAIRPTRTPMATA